MSRTYRIKATQILPVSPQKAWDYFSNPNNLQHITPPSMGFTVTSETDEGRIYPGLIIEYRIRPVLGIPLYWMTEITHVRPPGIFRWMSSGMGRTVSGTISITLIPLPKGWK